MLTHFGLFVLDSDARQLLRDGVAVHLTPKAYELLTYLVGERPRAASKAVLLNQLWPDAFVVEANLSNLVAEIRTALGDDSRKPSWIRTLHGFGYAFAGTAMSEPATNPAVDAPRYWLDWGPRRFWLGTGAHIVGRDADADIRLDAPSVSRKHARIVVTAEGVFVEDCGSKNGTRHRDARVVRPVWLADGDAVRFGSIYVTFRHRLPITTTTTGTGSEHPG